MKQGQFPAIFNLADLNGQNGFKIDGENNGDQSGVSVGTVGDINGDGYTDLLIGAFGYLGGSNKGRSYVVFGGPGTGSSGVIALSSLNGTNGFKLDGENNGDASGFPVRAAGDINNDGYADLLIGAHYWNNHKGRSYVVFGGPEVGITGTIALSSLNGANGFKLDGENNGDYSGISVSAAGDINADGHADFLIGAYSYPPNSRKGRTYVVFGGPGVGSSGTIALSSLNGANGFKLDGENNGDFSGRLVSAADDINDDGHADLLIGAYGYPGGSTKGRSYVVFGGPGIGSSGIVVLSSLNGVNGFKLDGENNNDYSGYLVSAAGDINGDRHADLLIGSPWYPGGSIKGRSYVVFGGPGIGSGGVITLSSLSGANGFKLDGENNGDYSSLSGSAAGDINGDGYVDLLIGSPGTYYAPPSTITPGYGYVIFGHLKVGMGGLLPLSALNGTNGFKLKGETIGDTNGFSVSTAGDINGDEVTDLLIGAWNYNKAVGRSYVVFGDVPPVLVNNSLSLYANETILINSNHLAAYDLNHDNNTLMFVPSNFTHGQFEFASNPGKAIANFTQQQITAGEIQFVPDGTIYAPSYNITVRTAGIAYVSETPANITFNLLQIKNNQLIINQGQLVALTTENLSAMDTGGQEEDVAFIISDLQHGQFQWLNFPDQPILTFRQQNITDGLVSFVHDGSADAPVYQVAVNNGRITTAPQTSIIDFDPFPIIVNNMLRINQGEFVILSVEILSATHVTSDPLALLFVMSDVQHGTFSLINTSTQPIFSFYQQNITDGQIQFNHDGSVLAPGYIVSVTDGRVSSPAQSAWIDFDAIPVLENNTLIINQGQRVIFNAEMLGASHATGEPNALLFNISDVQHGQFSFIDSPTKAIINLYQQNITDQSVQFTHDNSTSPPAYKVMVTDGRLSSAAEPAVIDFDATPILQNNSLVINQGQTVIFNAQMLSATHPTGEDSILLFVINNITHGQFNVVTYPDQSLLQFYQQNITDQHIQFTHDNSTSAPVYQVSVTDQRIKTSPQSARIDFDANPILVNNTLIINQGQRVILDSSCLSAIHTTGPANALVFNLSEVQHGQFSWSNSPNQAITNFYQQNVTDGRVQFTHDNSTLAPAYRVSVTDGRITTPPASAQIDFDTTPLLLNNSLRINQGQSIILTSSDLAAMHPGKSNDTLQFVISQLTHGNFSLISAPQFPLKTFQQQNITDGLVQFTQDGSAQSPAYAIVVTDGRLSTSPQFAVIDFDPLPILVNNQLKIGQGQTVTLTTDNLLATHAGITDPQLMFIITNISNGHFIVPEKDFQSVLSLDTSFQQQQIMDQAVLFYQQGTDAPTYAVSVSDGRVSTSPQPASINYLVKPILQNNQFAVSKGQAMVLTTDNLLATRSDQALETLQFLPMEMTHGQYERRSAPGVGITWFNQKEIFQQSILFVHDNSTLPPDGDLVVLDSSTGLSTDAQETHTLLLLNNHLPINQGETLPLTPEMLQAASNQAPADDMVFTPVSGTVQYGNFALKSTPNYPIPSFRQSQVTHGDIVFVPDGSAKAPSCYLTVSDGQPKGAIGTFSCGVDFDTPPTLDRAYLSIASRETVQIGSVNLKASSTRFPVSTLVFKISDLSHGFFADIDDQSKQPIFNFTQQQVTDNRILFTADNSSLSPGFQVSVWDSRMSCAGCPKPADVVFQSGSHSAGGTSEVIRNAIISAVASGVIGLLFFALKYKHSLSLQRNVRPTIDGAEQETYPDTLLLPIAREIFSRIKITGCLGYIGKRDYNEYIGAVSTIVAALETKGVIQPDRWNSLPRPQKQRIIDAIAMHTKELAGNNRCCSMRTFTSFYKAEVTPIMIRNKAKEIADAVQETLSNRTEAKGSRSRSSVRLTSASSGLNLNLPQIETPLLS